MSAPGELVAEVALGLPVRRHYHYRVPPGLQASVARGSVVVVPLGPRFVTGYVLGVGTEAPVEQRALKPLREVLEPGPAIPGDLLDLGRAVSEYYLAPLGEVLKAAVPGASVKSVRELRLTERGREALEDPALGETDRRILEELARLAGPAALREGVLGRRTGLGNLKARLRDLGAAGLVEQVTAVSRPARPRFERWLEVTTEGDAGERERRLGRSARARALLGALEGRGAPVAWDEAREALGASPELVRRLGAAGLLRVVEREIERDRAALPDASRRLSDLPLTGPQAAVVERLRQALGERRFAPFLLHGVTGSGKSLVYLACIEQALVAGRSALLLVPEIGLTPMLGRELKGRFGDRVGVLHSALRPGERYDAWRRARSGETRVVFGARSAVLAPLLDLGLIVVDEEHDPSYKQDDAPRYHGRDVAVLRAKQLGIPILLGSATPSLESYQNARSGRYRLLELPDRAEGRTLPAVEVVDLRVEYERTGETPILSQRLVEELAACLERGEQALLLLNRRGYASFLLCRECGLRADCPHCSSSLTYHRLAERLECHRCGHRARPPKRCPGCSGSLLHLVGHGTEKVEATLRARLPEARVARLDRDAVKGHGRLGALLRRFEKGEIDVLVGTQMVAKGHDFGRVTLVGVVSVDAMLGLPDFRATERTFSLLTQVAGRAGRGERPGLVILQTYYPDNEAVMLACLQDYPRFFEREMRIRKLMRYPPLAYLANLIVRGRDRDRVIAEAREVAASLGARLGQGAGLLGPAMAPVERVREQYRAQLLVRAPSRGVLRATLEAAAPDLLPRVDRGSLDLDVDPFDLL